VLFGSGIQKNAVPLQKNKDSMTKEASHTRLETEKIGKLLMQYAVPSVIAMTAASVYNIIDSIFIGHGVGALAITGLAITFPFMNLAAAFGSLVGVGASSILSVKLGQKDEESANQVLGNLVVLCLIIGTLFTTISLLFLDPILLFFGASEATLPYARDFMQIILIGNIVTHTFLGLNAMLRASGNPTKSMIAMICTVVINCALNAFFIFVLKLGIRGAATATVLAQVMALAWELYYFSRKSSPIHFTRKSFLLKKQITKSIMAIGMSPFLMNVAGCFVVILINLGLKKYGGDLMIGAYGIANRVGFFFVMVVIGINQGMQPIAGYNYGAGHYQRLMDVLKLTVICATIVTTTAFLAGMFIPRIVASAFTTDQEMIDLAARGISIMLFCFPIVGTQMVTCNFFQSIGKANIAIFLSLTRQLIFLIPFLIIFPHLFEDGAMGIWYSMPVSDFLASVVAYWVLGQYYRKLKKKVLEESN
jgi:putative MATE family efflux protein